MMVADRQRSYSQEKKARWILAKRIRILRAARGWSQEVLAELSGLHRSYIGSVEGMKRNISLDNIEKIADAFEVSISDLLTPSDLFLGN